MTFTKDDLKAARFALEGCLKSKEHNARREAGYWFANEYGLGLLAALEEAWQKNKTLMRSLYDIRCCIVNLAQNGGELNVDDELIALISVIDDVNNRVRATEEE